MTEALKSMPILVVDDEEANALLLTRFLEGDGFEHVVSTREPTQVAALCA